MTSFPLKSHMAYKPPGSTYVQENQYAGHSFLKKHEHKQKKRKKRIC